MARTPPPPPSAPPSPEPTDVRPPLPEAFVARLQQLLGAEADALVAALQRPPEAGLRVNPRRLDLARLGALTDWRLEPLPWCADGALLVDAGGERPGRYPLHEAGAYYLQDPSAMVAVEALAPRLAGHPDPWVLDLAAAPGGKSTQLAGHLGDRGLLVANDVHPARVRALGQNLERWGAANALVAQEAPATLARRWGAVFDAVLLDAPCSGEGMFRKSDDARAMWSEGAVHACAARQHELLRDAHALLAPGGWLAYATCTFAPEEDEGAVARFLAAHPDMRLEPLALPGTDPGRPAWAGDALPPEAASALAGCARLWPHRARGDGHFVALMRKADGPRGRRPLAAGAPAPRRLERLYRAFAADALGADPVAGWRVERQRELLVAVPPAPPSDGVRTLRRGLQLGRVRSSRSGERFEPAHALALAAPAGGRELDLALDDPRLGPYLAGLELEADGDDGWLVVRAAGCALGWGKRVRGVLRNHFPKGLRWR